MFTPDLFAVGGVELLSGTVKADDCRVRVLAFDVRSDTSYTNPHSQMNTRASDLSNLSALQES